MHLYKCRFICAIFAVVTIATLLPHSSAMILNRQRRSAESVCLDLNDVEVDASREEWYSGSDSMFKKNDYLKLHNGDSISSATLTLTFDEEIEGFQQWDFNGVSFSADKTTVYLTSAKYTFSASKEISFIMKFESDDRVPTLTSLKLQGTAPSGSSLPSACGGEVATTESPGEETTQAPAETTQAPAETTQAPAETTQAPAETTQAPEATTESQTNSEACDVTVTNSWGTGKEQILRLPITVPINGGWHLELTFDSLEDAVVDQWDCENEEKSSTKFSCDNKSYNANINSSPFEFKFQTKTQSSSDHMPELVSVRFSSGSYVKTCSQSSGGVQTTTQTELTTTEEAATTTESATTEEVATTTESVTTEEVVTTTESTSTTESPDGSYNYALVLQKSLLFYEAQRSGYLPSDNRIPWRGNSGTNDGSENNVDLEGGYLDAGDGLKLGLPMAFTISLLAWGMIDYQAAYAEAGQDAIGRDAIKWATDYFIKCHVSDNEFYGQVGNSGIDHSYPGRIEDFTGSRPAYKIDTQNPGSDLAGETAAAMAAASILFSPHDSSYASTLLDHARKLYTFAKDYPGFYKDANHGFCCYTYNNKKEDELAWAAAWLYRATNEQQYLTEAENYAEQNLNYRPSEFSWSDKTAGVHTLLASLSSKTSFRSHVSSFTSWLRTGATKTPKGLVFINEWGSNRHAANAAFICLQAAKLSISSTENQDFARQQIHYMLGDSGRSYVVGFGNNPPKRPHHRNSACQGGCSSWAEFNANTDNHYTLNGALVGGPGQNDDYADVRTDYKKNEVAIDYNAGFQSAVAALYSLEP